MIDVKARAARSSPILAASKRAKPSPAFFALLEQVLDMYLRQHLREMAEMKIELR
jgi:hypothetical protein